MEASTSVDDHGSTSDTSTNEGTLLHEGPLDFSSPWHFSDVVLVVEDTKLHVHKSTLSMWSPVFKAMFMSQFVESSAKEIPLPGKRADEVKELLRVIYSSWSKPIVTEENYKFLLQLADEYQMDQVKELCSEFLVNKIQVTDCLGFFKLADQFSLDDVTEKCYKEVRYNTSADLEGSEHFNGFDPELKVDICMRVIKELERTLEEYVTTCFDLVKKVYKQVYENCYSDINFVSFKESISSLFNTSLTSVTKEYWNTTEYSFFEHEKVHKGLQNTFHAELAKAKVNVSRHASLHPKDYNTKYFDFSCRLCLEQVQTISWKNSNSYDILKTPVKKLYALQQGKIAKEAKERADKRKLFGQTPFNFFTSSS